MKAPSLKFSYTAGDLDYKHECPSFTFLRKSATSADF